MKPPGRVVNTWSPTSRTSLTASFRSTPTRPCWCTWPTTCTTARAGAGCLLKLFLVSALPFFAWQSGRDWQQCAWPQIDTHLVLLCATTARLSPRGPQLGVMAKVLMALLLSLSPGLHLGDAAACGFPSGVSLHCTGSTTFAPRSIAIAPRSDVGPHLRRSRRRRRARRTCCSSSWTTCGRRCSRRTARIR